MPDVSLKEHLESQIKWLDRYFVDQVKAIDAKTILAKSEIDTRLQGMNEFRDTLKDQASRLATKTEMTIQTDNLDKRVKAIELIHAEGNGKTIAVAGIVAFIASILVVVIAQWLVKVL